MTFTEFFLSLLCKCSIPAPLPTKFKIWWNTTTHSPKVSYFLSCCSRHVPHTCSRLLFPSTYISVTTQVMTITIPSVISHKIISHDIICYFLLLILLLPITSCMVYKIVKKCNTESRKVQDMNLIPQWGCYIIKTNIQPTLVSPLFSCLPCSCVSLVLVSPL